MAQVLSSPGVKPQPWRVRPGRVVPEGQWAWEGKPLWFPFWSGGGSPFEIATGLKGTLVGDVAWTVGTRGPGMDFPDQQVSGESIDFPQTERTHPTGQSLVVIGGGTRRASSGGAGSGGCVVSTDNQNSDGYRLFAFDDGTCRFRLMQSGSGSNVDTSLTWSAGDRIILVGRYDGSEQRVIAHNLTTGARSTNAVSNSGNLTTDTSKDLYVGNVGTGGIGGSSAPWYGVLEVLHITTTLYPVAAIDRLITTDLFAPFRPRRRTVVFVPASSVTTLTADAGAYSLTGATADLLRSLVMDATSGSYSVTGSTASLLRSLLLSGDAGSYSVSGASAGMLRALLLSADAGSYSVAGQAADLLRALLMSGDAGTYTLTGAAATLAVSGDVTLTAEAGSYSVSGSPADLLRALLMGAEAGSYQTNGQTADLLRALVMAAESGAMNVSGQQADLLRDLLMEAEAGTLSLVGEAATLTAVGAALGLSGPFLMHSEGPEREMGGEGPRRTMFGEGPVREMDGEE